MTRALLLAVCVVVSAACGDDDDGMVVPDAADDATLPDGGMDASADQCAELGITDEGECLDAVTVVQCVEVDGARVPRLTACAGTTACVANPTPKCVDTDACAAIGPAGRCEGDTVVRCGEEPVDCTATSGVCAWVSTAVGYACTTAAEAGPYVVRGVVRYDDRPVLGSELSDPVAVPARGVTVLVIADSDSAVLATAHTADDGSYTLRYTPPATGTVHVTASTVSTRADRPVRVRRTNGATHAFGGASFAPVAEATADLHVDAASTVVQAFNVHDNLVRGMDVLRGTLGVESPAGVSATWQRGSTNGTYYAGGENGIYLLGETADDDGYDDSVILHELGHYWEDEYSRSDSPGGSHDGSPVDPRLAWSEGFSTYLSGMVRGTPTYADTNATGGWDYDMDSSVTVADPDGGLAQDMSEDTVSEILWDAGVSVSHAAVLAVGPAFAEPGWTSRGHIGVDLVDWLDEFISTHGPGLCSLAIAVRLFPYDGC